MRKLAFLLALAVVLGAALFRAAPAFADQPEMIVGSFVGTAHMDIWKHADGHWQKGLYNGKENVTEEAEYDPKALGIDTTGYKLTRVTLTYPFGLSEYDAAGRRKAEGKIFSWEEYSSKYYERRAAIHGVEVKSFDQSAGTAIVEWRFDLVKGGSKPPWNLTHPEVRRQLHIKPPPGFEDSVEGYRYELPVIITWYGVPQGAMTPNFYVKDFDPGVPKDAFGSYVAEAGKQYTATVTFGAKDMWQGGAKVFPAVASVAGLHKVGDAWYRADVSELSSAYAGARYASAGMSDAVRLAQAGSARLLSGKTSAGQQLVFFEVDGAEVRLKFTWTAENAPETTVGAAINVLYPRQGSPVIRPVWFEGGSPPSFSGPLTDADITRFVQAVMATLEGSESFVFDDNVVTAKVKIISPDFYVKSLDPGTSEVEEGVRYSGTVVYGLKGTVSGPVRAKLELTHNGYSVPDVDGQVVEFRPGEEKGFTFSFTGQNRDSVLEAKIRPVSGEDANWADNSKRAVVPLRRRQQPGAGSLTFQAVSQTRKYTRPPGTAKWTDWVTVTLRPPEPVPPRGRVVSWSITGATLTYPKKNPNFTFGNPLPPVGTRTVEMTPKGHEATVEFQEDWALDGARIYNILTGEIMAAEPKHYTITASYTVTYAYEWEETEDEWVPEYDENGNEVGGHWEPYTVTRRATGTASGTATGELLVNGTGVDSRAQ